MQIKKFGNGTLTFFFALILKHRVSNECYKSYNNLVIYVISNHNKNKDIFGLDFSYSRPIVIFDFERMILWRQKKAFNFKRRNNLQFLKLFFAQV